MNVLQNSGKKYLNKKYLIKTKIEEKMIPFNKPPFTGNEIKYIKEAFENNHICGDGIFTKKCTSWLNEKLHSKVLYTTSCTHALEMAAWLLNIQPGDEVIMPSYTFASTADAFASRGAKIVFVDIRPDTMNIDERKIEEAITDKTKVIVPVHYAGVSCEMDTIMEIAQKNGLYIVEDAAQAMMSSYHGKALGTFGDFGCFSFHETKNYSMGEGGALCISNKDLYEKAEIIREKGTNRSKFWRGEIDKYTWVDLGSSYLPSEINMAYLYAQLEMAEMINTERLRIWNIYNDALKELANHKLLELPYIPEGCQHNAHMFYIKCKDLEQRSKMISELKGEKIYAVFHYIPLHSAPAGKKYGVFWGDDYNTITESERLLRLPLWYGITDEEVDRVINAIYSFFDVKRGK